MIKLLYFIQNQPKLLYFIQNQPWGLSIELERSVKI